jgi:hypothetical protein
LIDFTLTPAESIAIVKTRRNVEVRICHPDKNSQDVTAAAAATRWNDAYEKLMLS